MKHAPVYVKIYYVNYLNNLWKDLSHIAYKLAVENKKVAENPARLVKLLAENNERVRWLEAQEEQALRRVVQARWPEREPELDLALHTGLRWAEQYNLRWTDVSLERKLLTLPKPKGGKLERMRISSQAAKALAALRTLHPGSELVFPGGDWVHRLWWTAARTQARLADLTWHDLRHTVASRRVMAGVDILTVNKLMRHKNLQVTMR
jgi:integrase